MKTPRLIHSLILFAIALVLAGCAKPYRQPIAEPTGQQNQLLAEIQQDLPIGSNIYEVMVYLNQLRTQGVIDNFHFVEHGEETAYAWKQRPDSPSGLLIRLDVQDHILRGYSARTYPHLPPPRRAIPMGE